VLIYLSRVHAGGPSIFTSQRVLGSWDLSCDILLILPFLFFYIYGFFLISDSLLLSVLLVLLSYHFPAPACVFSPIPWVLGLSISSPFFSSSFHILPFPSCSQLPRFLSHSASSFYFQMTQVYQYLDPTLRDCHVASLTSLTFCQCAIATSFSSAPSPSMSLTLVLCS